VDQRLGLIPAFAQIPSSRHLELGFPGSFRRRAKSVPIADADSRGLLWADLQFEPHSFPIEMKRHPAARHIQPFETLRGSLKLLDHKMTGVGGRIGNEDFATPHANLVSAIFLEPLLIRATHYLAQTAPVQRNRKRVQTIDEVDHISPTVLKIGMMSDYEAGLAQEEIKCEVVHSMKRIAPCVNREIRILQDCQTP